jgi:hypothetical protein
MINERMQQLAGVPVNEGILKNLLAKFSIPEQLIKEADPYVQAIVKRWGNGQKPKVVEKDKAGSSWYIMIEIPIDRKKARPNNSNYRNGSQTVRLAFSGQKGKDKSKYANLFKNYRMKDGSKLLRAMDFIVDWDDSVRNMDELIYHMKEWESFWREQDAEYAQRTLPLGEAKTKSLFDEVYKFTRKVAPKKGFEIGNKKQWKDFNRKLEKAFKGKRIVNSYDDYDVGVIVEIDFDHVWTEILDPKTRQDQDQTEWDNRDYGDWMYMFDHAEVIVKYDDGGGDVGHLSSFELI